MGGKTIRILGFPSNISVKEVEEFLAKYTGHDTIFAIKIRPPNGMKQRFAFVVVQFTSSEFADDISSKAYSQLLWYQGSYLKVKGGEHDIIPKPRIPMFKLENAILHIGCQVSDVRFANLWSVADVRVTFGFGFRKLGFSFSNYGVNYKLELSHECIWQIKLYCPRGEAKKFLLIQELEEYFTNYMVNDSLGIISHAHVAHADRELLKAESDSCKQLAELYSIAVDFPKTGVPAVMPSSLYVKEFPDFMEKPDRPTYDSTRVIGKLFRAIKDIAPPTGHIKSFTQEVAMKSYDHDMEVDGFQDYINDAMWYKDQYDFKLGNLMDHYEIKTEAEILSGSIIKMSKSFKKNGDLVEEIGLVVRSLKEEARAWFDEKGSATDPDVADDEYAKASAWYHITYHPDYWGCYSEGMKRVHFISFPWCVYDKLIHIKQKKMRLRRAEEMALQHSFGSNLRIG